MDWKWLKNRKVKLCMEIGLALVLAIALGVGGSYMEKRTQEEKLQANVAAENEAARQGQQIPSEQSSSVDEADAIEGAGTQDAQSKTTADAAEPEENEVSAGEVIADGQYPIMGNSSVTAEQMAAYYKASGAEYPAEELGKGGADSIETFCQIYCEEAAAEGVRPEVAFVQAMKETAWLKYGGDAQIEQFNFAGIGTTGDGVPGSSYADVRTGIRAQIQHLKAYATEDILAQECVDDRYEYVKKGSAPYVEWLGQKENPQGTGWAADENYGYSIVEMIKKLKQMQ